jgi:tetratricopeptide (TPR) repeat protein
MTHRLLSAVVCCIVFSTLSPAEEHHHGAPNAAAFGTVNFPTSCAPALRQDFNRAVALLHSFEYDTAREEFTKIADRDPGCAMARWGTAMTYFHGAWGQVDQEKGSKEAGRAREIAEKNPATTPRERQYIAAVSAIYSDPNATVLDRAKAFSTEMARLHEANPQDDEGSIFYALSLFVSSGSDNTYANQAKCGEILQPLFHKLPNHPGVAHYLIHCYDNPALAQKGLSAAREYAKIAPDSAHATHMPSHIFVRLGLWQDTVQSNLASIEVAAHEPGPCHGRNSQLHAMHFLQFAYLQLGQQAEARKVADEALALPTDNGCASGEYIAASYALQAHDWAAARRLNLEFKSDDLSGTQIIWTAVGIAAARNGDIKTAQRSADELAKLREAVMKKIAAGANNPAEAAHLEVEAWIAQAQGDSAKALEQMRRADDIGGYPSWAQPVPAEELGNLLMEQHHPAEALAAYRKALENTANLFNALYGAATAADAVGHHAAAREYSRKLIEIAGQGDRPEIALAKKKVNSQSQAGD